MIESCLLESKKIKRFARVRDGSRSVTLIYEFEACALERFFVSSFPLDHSSVLSVRTILTFKLVLEHNTSLVFPANSFGLHPVCRA